MEAPAFNPMSFEQHVLKVCKPEPVPEIHQNLLRFIQRHAPDVKVVLGEEDGYDWRTSELIMSHETAKGRAMRSLLTVAHEVGHAHQQIDWPWIPVWALKFPIIRLWLECNAWQRALRFLS